MHDIESMRRGLETIQVNGQNIASEYRDKRKKLNLALQNGDPSIARRRIEIVQEVMLSMNTIDDPVILAEKIIALGLSLKADRVKTTVPDYSEALKKYLAWSTYGEPLPKIWGINCTMPAGLLTVLGGYAGIGKSRTLINVVYDSIMRGKRCFFYSNEMTINQTVIQLLQLHLYYECDNSTNRQAMRDIMRDGGMSETESLIEKINECLVFCDVTGDSASDILAKNEYFTDIKGLPDIVAIDYFHRIKSEKRQQSTDNKSRYDTTMEILTYAAKRTPYSWLLNAQTNREAHKNDGHDHSSFLGTGNIEQDAATCLIISRDKEDKNKMIMNVAKNREGKTGKFVLNLDVVTGALYASL